VKPSAAPSRLGILARLGIFGGSFDPVHAGHLHAARSALRAFDLDHVVFVPAREPPHKPGRELVSGKDRLEMLRLAIAGEPRFSVHGLELERPGPSFTIDTVRELPGLLGAPDGASVFLVLGSDNLAGLPTWRAARELLARVQPIVVHREGDPEPAFGAVERALGPGAAAKCRAGYLALPPVEVSSTELRTRLPNLGGEAVDLPRGVLAYIRRRGLYGTSA
jgi:nicotinate-nucleotide adenylyltransferase